MTARMSSADGSPGVRATCTKRSRLIWFSSWAGTEGGISRKTAWTPLLTFTTKFWPQRAQAQARRLVRGDSSKYQLAARAGRRRSVLDDCEAQSDAFDTRASRSVVKSASSPYGLKGSTQLLHLVLWIEVAQQ